MKFDHVVMNPPFCRNLHLKILNEAINHSDDVVNLSPIRWLQDPLAEYKRNSDWKKFENIRERIESIEIIKVTDAESLFNIDLPFNIGVYHITKCLNPGFAVPSEGYASYQRHPQYHEVYPEVPPDLEVSLFPVHRSKNHPVPPHHMALFPLHPKFFLH